ncbi:hypothetical protein BDD12DRAFT_892098 [Trichophaea hybrida]|nr:hypothetical protein BDD12DRAFT_892098 [Trichophaea hybrida]
MRTTSSVRSLSEMLQLPRPEATMRYSDKLAAEITAHRERLTEDDLWIEQGWLKGVPRETLPVLFISSFRNSIQHLLMWPEVRMHSDPSVQSFLGSFSSPLHQGQKRPHTNPLHPFQSPPAASPKRNRSRPRANSIVIQQLLQSPPDSSASPQIGEMGPLGLPSGVRDITIEEMRNSLLDVEFLGLAYTMQYMGLETVSDMISKIYAVMAISYLKHTGEPLEMFCPDPEMSLSQQLVVWKHRHNDLLEDREERKKKAKENPNIKNIKWEKANLQSLLGPNWSQ